MALAVEEHVNRPLIDEAFLNNRTLKQIQAELTPDLSLMALSRYRSKVIRPAVNNSALIARVCKSKNLTVNPGEANLARELTEEALRASPFRQRLESLWVRTEKAVNRAETAVRVVTDRETGETVAVGPDVSAIAPLLNQAHKNLEMLGNATGELSSASGPTTNNLYILSSCAPMAIGPAHQVIDVEAVDAE